MKIKSENNFSILTSQRTAIFPNLDGSDTPAVHDLVRPHLESWNSIFETGLLERSIALLDEREVCDSNGNVLRFWLDDVQVGKPLLDERDKKSLHRSLYPRECRERGISYKGKMMAKLMWSLNGGAVQTEHRNLGDLPIMVKSSRCHLEGLSSREMTARGEEAEEVGGYFIVNGIERLIRLLVVNRRNVPLVLHRTSLSKRGPLYSSYAIQFRSVREDETSQTIYLHYLTDGTLMLRVHIKKAEYLIPLMLVLRSLKPNGCTDREIMESIVQGDHKNTFLLSKVEGMLRQYKESTKEKGQLLISRTSCLNYLGERFLTVLDNVSGFSAGSAGSNTSSKSDKSNNNTTSIKEREVEVGREFLKRFIMPHLDGDDEAKWRMLLLLARKLYAVVGGQASPDNSDSPMNHEVLTAGQLFSIYLKEKMDDYLSAVRMSLLMEVRRNGGGGSGANVNFDDASSFRKTFTKAMSAGGDVGKKMEYLLATGNIASSTGLDLQQTSGFTIVAEKLNFLRYISHFRSIHRGAFFAELKTTSIRKLMPEAWGFLCPVHTPDGSPCGLLNHLAHQCRIVTPLDVAHEQSKRPNLSKSLLLPILLKLGCHPLPSLMVKLSPQNSDMYPVVVEGEWVANVPGHLIEYISARLRYLKSCKLPVGCSDGFNGCNDNDNNSSDENLPYSSSAIYDDVVLPPLLEVAAVPVSNGGLFPGLYLFYGAARMMRPVKLSGGGSSEGGDRFVFIGSMEQVYLDIEMEKGDLGPLGSSSGEGLVEMNSTNIMSMVANLTPFPDLNQSPRNMYQCQMGKQSMATPLHSYPYRSDNKLYRLTTPQTPIVRTKCYRKYGLDHYPIGCNAVVAVISYTGYDMEDAMILNKSSYERGFGHGTVYKTEKFDIQDRERRGEERCHFFGHSPKDGAGGAGTMEVDGLPHVGLLLKPDDPMFSVIDEATGRERIERYKGFEDAYVDQVGLLGTGVDGGGAPSKISIKLRMPRRPIIGDKFSSRHGQKGVCSQKYPIIDMPFTESGMNPDIIINPHAFPSRMTIGMFVESIAAKAGAVHGLSQDATPFEWSDKQTASDFFGEQLKIGGYNYYGNEPMYSGVTGEIMRADIYIGVVYYQRLRHMVSDKFQVRTTGPVHNLTQQPVKGRKRAGGIRFGEMERDSLLAHGVSFLLQDRLMNCSDYSQSYVCRRCGSCLSPIAVPLEKDYFSGSGGSLQGSPVHCHTCQKDDAIDVIAIPFVLRYLSAELMAMNIKLKMHVN